MMTSTALACHDCGAPLDGGDARWIDPTTATPDFELGEPHCEACAPPGAPAGA